MKVYLIVLISFISLCKGQSEEATCKNLDATFTAVQDASNPCQYSCFVGSTKASDTINKNDMTPCGRRGTDQVCLGGQCTEARLIKHCASQMSVNQTLISATEIECTQSCNIDKVVSTVNKPDGSPCRPNDKKKGPPNGKCKAGQCQSRARPKKSSSESREKSRDDRHHGQVGHHGGGGHRGHRGK